jgi:hypothetical protein
MPVIDGEGLSGGKRLRRCSDKARLLWPYLFCNANGYGRFEIDCPKIIAHCFLDFKTPPTRRELLDVIEEYRAADLLFVWKYRGETWGQWDTKDKFLKRHKTASDKESPTPPAQEFSEWKRRISENKGLPNFSAQVGEKVLGEGVGKGVGGGSAPIIFPKKEPTDRVPGLSRFLREYPGEVKPDWDAQIYLSTILTDEDEKVLFHNLDLWRQTTKWLDGFIPSAENFLRKGHWKHPPKPHMIPTTQPEYPKELM